MSVEVKITAEQFNKLTEIFKEAVARNQTFEEVGLEHVPMMWQAHECSRFFVGVFDNVEAAVKFKLQWG